LSSNVMASTGQVSTQTPQEIQVSSSTTAGMIGCNVNYFLTFSPAGMIGIHRNHHKKSWKSIILTFILLFSLGIKLRIIQRHQEDL
jgi:hypothetical protein